MINLIPNPELEKVINVYNRVDHTYLSRSDCVAQFCGFDARENADDYNDSFDNQFFIVNDVVTDLTDGLLLVNLLEVLR